MPKGIHNSSQTDARIKWNKAHTGENHPRWVGGKYTDKKRGYVRLNTSTARGVKRIYEHVAIMEEHLGRPLFPGETVHHKNGIRNENVITNLELRIKAKHPKGSSIEEMLAWATEIVQRYAPTRLKTDWQLAQSTNLHNEVSHQAVQ